MNESVYPFIAEKELSDRFDGFRRSHPPWTQEDYESATEGSPTAHVERLLTDMEACLGISREEPVAIGGLSGMLAQVTGRGITFLDRIIDLHNRLLSRTVVTGVFDPCLTIDEWYRSPPETVTFRTDKGVPAEEVIPLLRAMQFKTECLEEWSFPLELHDTADAKDLAFAITGKMMQSVNAGGNGVASPYWNPARQFNPDRVLRLRLARLVWNPLEPRQPCVIECDGKEGTLALPEERIDRGPPVFPSHPTLPAPWRVLDRAQDGRLWEVSLEENEEAAKRRADADQREALQRQNFPAGEKPDHVSQEEFDAWIADMRSRYAADHIVARDAPELPVTGRYELASSATPAGLKAREIWFQRFREVLRDALPAPRRALVFLLEERMPCQPFRTFVAHLKEDAASNRPSCPECGRPYDVAILLNFIHHGLPFRLPAASLFLYTCREDHWDLDAWAEMWLERADAINRATFVLKEAQTCLSGPPVWVTEYETRAVDEDAFDTSAEAWPRFSDSWEKRYRLFALQTTKAGGVPGWIQGSDVPNDKAGNPMHFIGQVASTEFLEMGDSGILYLFYSPETGETRRVMQFY